MASYGQAERTPSSDANEGLINPPASAVVARSTSIKKQQQVGTEIDYAGAGETLGTALQSYMDKDFANTRAKLELEGATRQGQAKAIVDIEKDNKFGGFAEALFGQKASYRGAQQQAAKNNVNGKFLEEMYNVSKYASDTPDEYAARQKDNMETMLKPFAKDVETKNMIAMGWANASEKLATAQAKEHYAIVQSEHRKEKRKELRGQVDAMVAMNMGSEEKEAAADLIFNSKLSDMTDLAYTSLVQEEINHGLMQGNNTLYELSKKDRGDQWKLTPEGQVLRDRAIAVADQRLNTQGNTMTQKAKTDLNDLIVGTIKPKDPDAYLQNALDSYQGEINTLEKSATGSDSSKLKIAALRNGLNGLENQFNNAANALLIKNAKQKLKDDKLMQEMLDEYDADVATYAQLAGDPDGPALLATIVNDTKKQRGESLDRVILSIGEQVVGWNDNIEPGKQVPMTEEQLLTIITTDSAAAKNIADMLVRSPVQSPMLTSLFQNHIAAFGRTRDASGNMIEPSNNTIQSMRNFENTPFWNNMIKGDDRVRWEQMKRASMAGLHMDVAEKHADNIIAKDWTPDSLKIDYGTQFGTDDRHTLSTYVEDKLTTLLGQEPTEVQMRNGLAEWNDALRATGTRTGSDVYLENSIKHGGILYRGQKITGGKYLDKIWDDYTFADGMDTLQNAQTLGADGKPKGSMFSVLLVGTLGIDLVNDGQVLKSMGELKGWEITADPNEMGFTFHAVGGKPYFLSNEHAKLMFGPILTTIKHNAADQEAMAGVVMKRKAIKMKAYTNPEVTHFDHTSRQ